MIGLSLPSPAIYEQEYTFWPWGQLVSKTCNWIVKNAKENDCVVDYMCGTGYLLNQIFNGRKDLKLFGCSLNYPYIKFGKLNYPSINFKYSDVLRYNSKMRIDIAICTAGLHHLNPNKQKVFINKLYHELRSGSYFLIGEEVIRNYKTEKQRKRSIHELWTAIITHLIENNAPRAMIQAALNVELNDLFQSSEYKFSIDQLKSLLKGRFIVEKEYYIWPKNKPGYGDVLLICKRK